MKDASSNDGKDGTVSAVRKELGLPESVGNDLEGLRTIYAAWCGNMTFDNMRKFISLRSGDERLYFRKVTPDGLVVILGHTMFRRVGEDLAGRELSAGELLETLHEIGGVLEKFIVKWADAGGLEVSMNEPGKGPEMPDLGPRPSRRNAKTAADK